jgi:single-strand DNA-binding protein
MSSVNKCIILGRVGQMPEVKAIQSGNKVAKFSVATSEKYKDKAGEKKEDTTWHNIEVWGKLSDIVEQYVKKGDMIYLEGKIKTDSYEKDGVKKFSTKIVADTIQMLGGNKADNTTQPKEHSGFTEAAIEDSDGLPF